MDMKDFIVTLFIENYIERRKLSELLNQCEKGILTDVFYQLKQKIYLPIIKKEEAFWIDYSGSQLEIYLNGKACMSGELQNGALVTIKNTSEAFTYSLLFIENQSITLEYQKYALPKGTNIFIGRSEEHHISTAVSESLSRKHAGIRVEQDGTAYIEDLSGKMGVFVNNKRTHSAKLALYDEIYIMGLSILYMGEYIAIGSIPFNCKLKPYQHFSLKEPQECAEKECFVRSPRILKSLETGRVEIAPPTSKETKKEMPALLTMGPSLTMALAMCASLGVSVSKGLVNGDKTTLITSGVTTLSMLLGTLMWPVLLKRYQQRQDVAKEQYRKEKYLQYIGQKDAELKQMYERNTRVWHENLAPSPDTLCDFVLNPMMNIRLWERSIEDSDFLSVRLGVGERPFEVELSVPKDGFSLEKDELRQYPQDLRETYKTLKDAPITLSLMEQKNIGMIGRRQEILDICQAMALNITALHAYDEVKTVFIYSEEEKHIFDWTNDLPSTWSNDRSMRYVATTKNEVHQIFNSINEIVQERESVAHQKLPRPYFVIFVADDKLIEGEALNRYLENPDNKVGISTVFVYGNIAKLPSSCRVIIQDTKETCGIYKKNQEQNRLIPFTKDNLDESKLKEFAKTLSNLPIKLDHKKLSVPQRISFLQMYQVGNIEQLGMAYSWDNNDSYQSLAAPIGVKAGGDVLELDIHEAYHGCHGLVAGMTGSGKSEFLQAYILSMMVNYSPNEVAFVLVDFKGGDMARPFMAKARTATTESVPNAPHLAATISNLSGNILYRALVSFEAEIKRRQNTFNKAAAQLGIDKIDINSYQKYFKEGKLQEPLPHLIIVIDEFAQLKSQHPEFLAQLINVAQVGRSLGIHLILATQRPSGLVDPQIWSNSRFRVCLKVLDKQDSSDMIGRSDAALIKNPGRCYVQVGYDEVFEQIQSGYSGADYVAAKEFVSDDEITVSLIDHTATPIRQVREKSDHLKTGKTQLEEIVKAMIELGEKKNLFVKPLWCELLPEKLYLKDLQQEVSEEKTLGVAVGLLDDIHGQCQYPLVIDLIKDGHVAIYGASGTGKTTFLQTLLYGLMTSYTPEEVNMYIFDFGGRTLSCFSEAPHCGGVIFADEEEAIASTFMQLQEMIEERKRLFAEHNCGSYSEYLKVAKSPLPLITVVIDNYSPLRETYYKLQDVLVGMVAVGKAYGVHMVITGNSKNAIYYKVTEHISNMLTLNLNDPYDYRDILGTSTPLVPDQIKGRGITVKDKRVMMYQVALICESDTEAERIKHIYEEAKKLGVSWQGQVATKVEVAATEIPQKETSKPTTPIKKAELGVVSLPKPQGVQADEHTLVIGEADHTLYGVGLEKLSHFFVGGRDTEKRLSALNYIASYLKQFEHHLVVVGEQLEALKDKDIEHITKADEFDDFIERLVDEANIRKEQRDELEEDGIDAENVYGNMSAFTKIFVIIPDFPRFFDMISDKAADSLEAFIKDCRAIGIWFITSADYQQVRAYNVIEIYKYLIKTPYGMVCQSQIEVQDAGLISSYVGQDLINYMVKDAGHASWFYTENQCMKVVYEEVSLS